jgi:RNA polymerase sigma factor (sigma-70 family)
MSTMASADDVETYRRHSFELIRYATVLVGPADAADVVADAVLSAFAAPSWRDVVNRRAYLYRSVLHHAATLHRSTARRRRREEIVAAASRPVAEPPPDSVDAHRALAALSEQQRAVTYLTYWEDLSPDRIAGLLGVSEGTVRKQLARARDHLRRILDA